MPPTGTPPIAAAVSFAKFKDDETCDKIKNPLLIVWLALKLLLPVVAKLAADGMVLRPLRVAIAYPLEEIGKVIIALLKLFSTILCGIIWLKELL